MHFPKILATANKCAVSCENYLKTYNKIVMGLDKDLDVLDSFLNQNK